MLLKDNYALLGMLLTKESISLKTNKDALFTVNLHCSLITCICLAAVVEIPFFAVCLLNFCCTSENMLRKVIVFFSFDNSSEVRKKSYVTRRLKEIKKCLYKISGPAFAV